MNNVFLAARRISEIHDAITERGIRLEYGSDFGYYNEIVASQRGSSKVSDPFNATLHFLNAKNAFWIIGRDQSGAVIHTQAVKQIDLYGATLGEYLTQFYKLFQPAGPVIDLDFSTYALSPGATKIQGRVCYHGDVWLEEGAKYRGGTLAALLTRLLAALTYLQWTPDYVFGFVPDGSAYRGLAERESYLHNEPDVLKWRLVGDETSVGFMVWNSREDVEYVLSRGVDRWLAG